MDGWMVANDVQKAAGYYDQYPQRWFSIYSTNQDSYENIIFTAKNIRTGFIATGFFKIPWQITDFSDKT